MKPIQGLCVVKVGGSVVKSHNLSLWLGVIKGSTLPVVIVPGGGIYADEVRDAQKREGFSDHVAHEKALMAMDRMAIDIATTDTIFKVVTAEPDIHQYLGVSQIPIWGPYEMCASCKAIPANWSVTSDSLALWLANKLGAENLFLIKSAGPPGEPHTAEGLSKEGFVDLAFPEFLRHSSVSSYIAGPNDQGNLASVLAGKTCKFPAIGLA